jgi:opacity protein-like surface antigen
MKRTMFGVAVGLVLLAGSASAQSVKPFSIGISGGLSVPAGDFGKGAKSGFNVSGMFEIKPPLFPVALRAEVQYQKFDAKVGDGGLRTIGGLVNAVYYLPSPGIVHPYFTGGLGLFNGAATKCPAGFTCSSETKFGYDLGAGVQFQLTGISTFVEANWQSMLTSGSATNMFPVRVGVRF